MVDQNPVNICFIKTSHVYDLLHGRSAGGAERQILLLARELNDRGHHVSIVTEAHPGPPVEIHDGIRLINGPETDENAFGAVRKTVGYLSNVALVDADIFYIRGDWRVLSLVSAAKPFKDADVIFNISNDDHITGENSGLAETISDRVFSRALRSCEAVVAQTGQQQSILASNYGVRSTVIPNGYSVPPESEVLPADVREYFLWVGRLDPEQKKPDRFLDLAEELPGLNFRMIGPVDDTNPYHRSIQDRAREADNVNFRGFVPPDEIHDHYREAIALVNTSDFEGFPNTFLEAWRYGTPTISMFHPLNGHLERMECGFLSGGFEALVGDVNRIANDPELAATIVELTRTVMEERYAIENVTSSYEGLFTNFV